MKKLLGLALAVKFTICTIAPVQGNDDTSEVFCSDVACLIGEINEANTRGGANVINLEPGSYTLTSRDNSQPFGSFGLPAVTSELTINGLDAETTIIERDPSATEFGIIYVAPGGNLTLNGVTLRGGASSGGGAWNDGTLNVNYSIIERNGRTGGIGGGITNGGILNVTQTIIARNLAMAGAGIENTSRGTAILTEVSIVNNFATAGGGVRNFRGTMTIQNSTIRDNAADAGGGIDNFGGVMEIKNTTIADNVVRGSGAGVFNSQAFNSGSLKIINSTIARNRAIEVSFPVGRGGGIATGPGLELQNSILALNTDPDRQLPPSPDCFGPITSLGNNIIGDITGCDITLAAGDLVTDPGLGDFMDDGTPGAGHFPLLANSPAIDRGNDDVCSADPVLNTDQLGQSRVGPCDIGAIEFEGPLTIVIDIRPRRDPPNRINPNGTNNINVALLSGDGFDATLIDPNTVRFGATGVEAAPILFRGRDVNGDGQRDLVVQFQIPHLGIECGAASLTLTGQIPGGHSIISSSAITTTGCK